MKISMILRPIDSGHTALPEFQRGYVWNCDQVRGKPPKFFDGNAHASRAYVEQEILSVEDAA